jgi:spore maturation protein CgeB
LVLYREWEDVLPQARAHLRDADVGMVTSYCPDGVAASGLVLDSRATVRSFYDLDTPVTLARLRAELPVDYIGPRGLRDFDLVLSYTGGAALKGLQTELGARRVAPLYGSVDPAVHYPAPAEERFRADLSYLGTHSPDRDATLRTLFVKPARRLPSARFLLGGSKYDGNFSWQPNIYFHDHVNAADHPAFFSSCRLTLNVTRQPMAELGYCPSGRLFEATACGAPVISDYWEGLDLFFQPGSEILVAAEAQDVIDALRLPQSELARIARAGRERTLAEHNTANRAIELERILDNTFQACAQQTAEAAL